MSAGGPKSVAISRQSARRVVALGLVLLSVTVVGAALGGVTAAESQSGPIEISDWTDLNDIRNDTDADYVLVNDLNETTPGYETVAGPNANGGKGFDPIGGFNASFDGQGNRIANLTIDRPSENEVGLFRDTSGDAVIEEMILTGATVTGSDDVGGLVGSNSGTVSTSSVDGAVTGSTDVGGLVGLNDGTVSNSSTSGNVDGSDYVGGLVGYNNDGGGTVSESFATGAVTGSSDVGGLVGENFGTVTGAYWDTQATGQSQSAGGIGLNTSQMQGTSAAQNMEALDFTNTWRVVTSPPGYPELRGLPDGPDPSLTARFSITPENPTAGEQLTLDADPSTPESDIQRYDWTLGDGTTATGKQVTHTYTDTGQFTVELTVQNSTETDTATKTVSVSSPSSSVEISDWTDLQAINDSQATLSDDYVLVNDLNETTPGYDAVVANKTATEFSENIGGSFNKGDTVTLTRTPLDSVSAMSNGSSINVTITDAANGTVEFQEDTDAGNPLIPPIVTFDYTTTENQFVGFVPIGTAYDEFIGTLDGQGNTIADLMINRPLENYVAPFARIGPGSKIKNITLSDVDVAGGVGVGGLVGDNDGTVSNVSASGSVTSSGDVGGLVGSNEGTVSNVSASMSVNPSDNASGLVGDDRKIMSNRSTDKTVTPSFTPAPPAIGGLVGSNSGTVSESFATGAVTGSSNVGGLVGDNFGTVTGAYWDIQATGQSQSAGGIGLNTSQMQGASAAQNMGALDFTSTWRVVTNPPGYPELRSLPDGPPPSGSKTLSVIAKNATGETVSGAELILYTEDSEVVASRQTNQSGVASWSTLTSGEYSVELYGPSGAFWGATAVTVAGNNTSATVQRTAPRLSQVTLAGDENGDGGYYGGRPVTVSPEIQNDGPERPVRVQIKLDTNNNDTHEQSVLRGGGGTSIPTGEIGYYGYEFDPETNGTKQVRVVTETEINDDWIVTGDSGWIKSFEIEHNIVGFEPLGTGDGVKYSNSTTDSFADGVQAGDALLPDGTSLSDIELPGTDYETKNTSTLNESYPWSAVGKVSSSFGITGASCSGAIIEDNHVITAAHCVYNSATGTPAEVSRFNPGKIATTDFSRSINTSFIQIYKQWAENSNTTYDIAVLTLNETESSKLGVSSETGTFGYEAHSKNSPVYGSSWNPFDKEPAHLTGYPDAQNASFVDRQDDQWDMIVQGEGTEVKPSVCRNTHLCHDYASRGLFSQDTFGGQSGGPVWQLLPNKPTIISIHSGGYGYSIGFRFTDGIGVRITEKKHNDINEMIAHGYEHINESTPGVETPNSPPDGSSGSATGDPHLTTYDGVAYDFQAVGEFVLTNGSDNTPQVQARLRPIDTGAVSVISAVATQINGTPLTIDARDQQALTINGTSQSIEPGESVSVENGEIIRTPEKYIVVYPGADGVVDDGDSRLEVTLSGNRLDAAISLNRTAVDSVSGLLGSPDGNASNDLVLANGTVLSSSPSFETLYGQYRDDYRVTAGTSLFDYEDGESASGFFDPTYPSQRVTVDGLSDTTREQAIDAASAAGLEPGTAQFRDAVIDYALTGTQSYLDSASRAARQTSSSVDATPSETSLTAPGLSVTVESSRVISSNQSLNVSVAASHPDPGNVTVVISNSTEIVYEQNVTGAFNSEQTISWNTRVDGNGSLASAGNYTLSVIATTQAGVENITTSGFTLESPTPPPLPGYESAPQDPDRDGLFEDVDGDGEFTIFDVQAFFVNFQSETVRSNPTPFNFDESAGINIFDVQALFTELS